MEEGGSAVKRYPCNFCDRVFITAQALGGHQNSHRRERDTIKTSAEKSQFKPMQIAPPLSPFPVPTIQTNNPNNEDVPMPSEYNRCHPRQIYVPNRMVPKEFYYHPYAHRPNNTHQSNGPVPWNNLYFGPRYPSNNITGRTTSCGNLRTMPRYPFVFAQGGSSLGYQNQRLQPQNYVMFPQNNRGEIRNDLRLNLSTSMSIASDIKEGAREGPSVALMLNQVCKQENSNAEAKSDDSDGGLDLTLRL